MPYPVYVMFTIRFKRRALPRFTKVQVGLKVHCSTAELRAHKDNSPRTLTGS